MGIPFAGAASTPVGRAALDCDIPGPQAWEQRGREGLLDPTVWLPGEQFRSPRETHFLNSEFKVKLQKQIRHGSQDLWREGSVRV